MELVPSSKDYPMNKEITSCNSSSSKKELKTITSSRLPFLSEDVIIEILLRLPVKSLLRFKSVCKQWNTIIRSSSFIRSHVRIGSSFTSNIVHWQDWRDGVDEDDPNIEGYLPDFEGYLCSVFPDGTLDSYEVPYPSINYYVMHSSCNGIICISDGFDNIALWNPATRKVKKVSPSRPYNERSIFIANCNFDFGEDPTTGDLKIVFFDTQSKEQCQFSVYNSRTDSWKLIEEGVRFSDSELIPKPNTHTFSNGVSYWVKFHKLTHKTCILAFDMRNDLFEEIATPSIFKQYDEAKVDARLDFFDETLALLICHYIVDPRRIDIWLMTNKGCWTKQTTVLLLSDYDVPFGIWNRNQIYTYARQTDKDQTEKDELVVSDLNSCNIQRVGSVLQCYPHICRYKESLVQLQGNGILDFDTGLGRFEIFY